MCQESWDSPLGAYSTALFSNSLKTPLRLGRTRVNKDGALYLVLKMIVLKDWSTKSFTSNSKHEEEFFTPSFW